MKWSGVLTIVALIAISMAGILLTYKGGLGQMPDTRLTAHHNDHG